MITRVIDDGPRKGLASTIVRVIGEEFSLLREGDISEEAIRAVAGVPSLL
jgi:tRNA A37 threonylcarbamoyladenosine synthetase subunit TsaC/SUA5/YrdC